MPWALLLVTLVCGAGVGAVGAGAFSDEDGRWTDGTSFTSFGSAPEREALAAPPRNDAFDDPPSDAVIDRAIDDARRLHEETNARTMAAVSSDCQRGLLADPTAFRFDSCAAFDEAAAILQGGRAGFQSGPFNALAVSARQVAAARLVTSNYLAADSRLRQIRSRVQMALLPGIADPEPVENLVGAAAR